MIAGSLVTSRTARRDVDADAARAGRLPSPAARLLLPLSVVAALAQAACGACDVVPIERCDDALVLPAVDGAPTWHADVRPIVEGRCMRCHDEGGLGPFPLTTRDEVLDRADDVRAAILDRIMPPFPPAACCRPYANDPSLTPAQRAVVTTWLDGEAAAGDPEDVGAPLPPVGELPRIDLVVEMPEPYTPAPVAGTDDTRCFLLDAFERDTSVVGVGVVPGARALVHHALVLVSDPRQVPALQDADDAAEGAGFPCPGGVVWDGYRDWLGGWSPGWDGTTTPDGFGHKVKAGDRVLLTVHYSIHDGVEPEPDRTAVALMLDDDVEGELLSVAVFDGRWPFAGLPIPKDQDDVRFAVQFDPTDLVSPGKPLTAFAANLHMHERGKSGILGVRRADGAEDCLIQIDDWDHAWQGDYTFAAPIELSPDDQLVLECVFDNTGANQIPGQASRDLNWAEDQEMCVAFVTVAKPT